MLTLVDADLVQGSGSQQPHISPSLYSKLRAAADADDRQHTRLKNDLVCICFEPCQEQAEVAWNGVFGSVVPLRESSQHQSDRRIVWARIDDKPDKSSATMDDRPTLSVPALPAGWPVVGTHSATQDHPGQSPSFCVPVRVTLIDPIPMDRLVLQPHAKPGLRDQTQDSQSNVQCTINKIYDSSAPPIFRQGETWPETGLDPDNIYTILLTYPASQGIAVQGKTEVVLLEPDSEEPSANDQDKENSHWGNNTHLSASTSSNALSTISSCSSKRRHVSGPLDFNPDTFLSSSLFQSNDVGREDEEEDMEVDGDVMDVDPFANGDEYEDDDSATIGQVDSDVTDLEGADIAAAASTSLSASSGSLTPRPPSPVVSRFPHSMDPARRDEEPPLTNGHRHEEKDAQASSSLSISSLSTPQSHKSAPASQPRPSVFHGFPLSPVLLSRPPPSSTTQMNSMPAKGGQQEWPDDDSKAYLTLSGLARAGVFVGDWVVLQQGSRFRADGEVDGPERLVQVDVLDVPEEIEEDL